MAKQFVLRVFVIMLIYLLLAGVITAGDNSSRSLLGRQSDTVSYDEIENFIDTKILSRK